LQDPSGLAFDGSGNLFLAELVKPNMGDILEFTPDGARSTFASGLQAPNSLAFGQVPEPSALLLVAAGLVSLLVPLRLAGRPIFLGLFKFSGKYWIGSEPLSMNGQNSGHDSRRRPEFRKCHCRSTKR
jgi:hypothetical protein